MARRRPGQGRESVEKVVVEDWGVEPGAECDQFVESGRAVKEIPVNQIQCPELALRGHGVD